jgi:predicted phosphodiesterase
MPGAAVAVWALRDAFDMRIGVMSDIHGNSIALDAVLADGDACGVEQWWALGDLVALGHDPIGVLERLARVGAQCVAGNTERYVVTGDLPHPQPDDVLADPTLLPVFRECVASFAWTRGVVTGGGWLDHLAGLPFEVSTTLPSGERLLGVHASPGTDDGVGLAEELTDEELTVMLSTVPADVVFAGHTHVAMDRAVDGKRAVNLGSVSNPKRSDRCATYVVVASRDDACSIEHRLVDYDHDAVIAAVDECRHPAADYIKKWQLVR